MVLLLLLLGGFALCVGIQLYFLLVVFRRTAFFREKPGATTPLPGVTIVVCAWNEAHNLRQLLPLLLGQEYPDFEVVVVDDRSTDGTFDYLLEATQQYPALRRVRVDRTPAHVAPKKYALTLGIMAAQKEVLLLSDADCRPASPHWIEAMTAPLTEDKDVVLGFSPYLKGKGGLNAFIRFETFHAALHYFSLALAGRPYMGVGRNLLYRKALFLQNKGFTEHLRVLGGDDDLFVGRVATAQNTTVCLDPRGFVWSLPKTTWADWYRQKRRHLGVGQYYRAAAKWVLGLSAASQLGSWALLLPLLAGFSLRQHWTGLGITAGLFLLRLGMLWVIYARANQRLGRTLSAGALPFFDFLMALYNVIMGSITVFSKKKWKWR